jgi:hypothetical protein
MDDYTLRIRDLGSKNGTFINGEVAPSPSDADGFYTADDAVPVEVGNGFSSWPPPKHLRASVQCPAYQS